MSKVSVRIPTIGFDPRLQNAIESVLAQSGVDYDLMVVDNNVDDALWQKTSDLADQFHIPALRNPLQGLAENWNCCVETAGGEYVLILHMDDELLPGMLSKCASFLDAHPQAGMVHSDVIDVRADGRSMLRVTQEIPLLKAGSEAVMKVLVSNNIACSSVVVRRACYQELGLFLTGNPAPDLEMWARIGKSYDIGHLAGPLARVYLHLDSAGPRLLLSAPPQEIERQWLVLYEKMIAYLPEAQQAAGRQAMRAQLAAGLFTAANKAWRLRRWSQGQGFFQIARQYSAPGTWLAAYFKAVVRFPAYLVLR